METLLWIIDLLAKTYFCWNVLMLLICISAFIFLEYIIRKAKKGISDVGLKNKGTNTFRKLAEVRFANGGLIANILLILVKMVVSFMIFRAI